jgi:hypothetical protein
MTAVDDELRELLHERAAPPEAPPTRYESVLGRARVRRRRRVALAGAATGLAVVAAVGIPLAVLGGREPVARPVAASPPHPPLAELTRINAVVATGDEIKIGLGRGACEPEATGVAWLDGGRWHLAVWTKDERPSGERACVDLLITYTLRLPLSEPYAGQPVIDEASGGPVTVNGGPGYLLPTYLPPGYSLSPGGDEVTLTGPQGPIMVQEGGPDVGTVRDAPGWPYDVLDRPDIGGQQGMLIRYRNDGDNTVLRWTDGADRGLALQVFSATLDPQELVKIARSMR